MLVLVRINKNNPYKFSTKVSCIIMYGAAAGHQQLQLYHCIKSFKSKGSIGLLRKGNFDVIKAQDILDVIT